MTDKNPKLQEYAKIKAEIKLLEAKAKLLEAEVINQVMEVDGRKKEIVTDYASFILTGYKKWQYSKELSDKEELLKEKLKFMKHEEETTGKAVLMEDGYRLKCTIAKGVK